MRWPQWPPVCAYFLAVIFGEEARVSHQDYFLGSYRTSADIHPPRVLPGPFRPASAESEFLVHADPTFMVMDNMKRQFEQVVGAPIHIRALSIDLLREEALNNAGRKTSRYDIIAVDLPWIGEFAERGILLPLDLLMDVERLDTADFHPVGWRAAHWRGRPYGVPSQTTPELLFYRRDLFAEAGLDPPRTTDDVLSAARYFHRPAAGRFGVAWNGARGTPLGHTFLMVCGDFGQPVVNLRRTERGFDPDPSVVDTLRPTIDTPLGVEAAEYLRALMAYSPPDILSMAWYERIRPYATGRVAMAYCYTALAPYVELDRASPANGQTGYLSHPSAPGVCPIATVGGYVLGVPANLAPERRCDAIEALVAFTSREAQKLFVLNGSRTSSAIFRWGRSRGQASLLAHLRSRRRDVVARRASVLAPPAGTADFGTYPDLRRRVARDASWSLHATRSPAKGAGPRQRADCATRSHTGTTEKVRGCLTDRCSLAVRASDPVKKS